MELHIENESTIRDVQAQFNALYPFLQIQFSTSIQAANANEQKPGKAVPELSIKKLRAVNVPAILSIKNNVTVAQLLTSFRGIGLLAQVWRKSANQWVETSLTDDWTLEHQNKEAMIISLPVEKIVDKH